ncbi:mediator of RNA polymerase II transcription subunit 1 isoform X1 [Dermacentor albipictus]|uniref:mediator of RNA polymerase II transcription subunit 1 isoform X1 n=2 Tax=Dermacentor albipictus TaxID=60249 RepID=UPI0031FD1575
MAAVEKPAAVTPCPQVGAKDVIENSQNGKESPNENPRESLLEKLRAKAKHYKPWGDMAKALRMAIMEKHHLVDSAERSQLQKCLDMIQKSIKVTSMQSMIERLDTITRQQGLMFTTGPGGQECFISSDMFYVEVLLESSGTVNDVKISHHGDPLSCPELTQVLLRGDFAEFTKHLEGLASIYQLNADKKQKTKAYLALQALETDLGILSQLQSFMNEPSNLVHKSPVGILQPRKGGHPMKLTFFISPYDLLDVDSKSSIPLTVEAILEKGLGQSVSVCIESSGSHKLQTTSLISVTNTPEGKNLPSFAALSNLNSTMLPASFVLKLPKPIPMAVALVRKIHAVTLIECADTSTTQPLLSLIINQASEGKLTASSDRGLNVTLPDQQHCYYLLSGSPELPGVMVSGVPFTHPTHVPQILVFLRQQLLFNTLVASCVRPSSRQNAEMSHMFEVNTTSISNISISFEHPLDESLATVDLNLSEITSVKCRIYTLNSDISICTDEYASKVMQRCLSIPVTMRAVIRKAQGQRARMSSQGDSYSSALNSSGNAYLTGLPGYGPNPATGSFGDFTPAGKADGYRESEEEPGTLGSLLGGPLPSQSPNMMLMSMLSDVPSASNSPAAPGFPFLGQAKPRNKRKRKATTSSDGRSPKRREDDGGGTDPEEEPFLESEAGQNKAALLNPAEPAGATAEPATDNSASFLREGGGGVLFSEEGTDPGEANRPPGRKVKRVRSEEAREDIKLEREGSRSQDSGPKNLFPGGDSDKLSRSASPPVSFKIEKSGDSLKISKTDSKSGSKPRDSSELRKKMDNRKERKRKRAESVDSGCREPAVAASPESSELSQQAFNLSTKPHGSMSPSTSRPPLKKSTSSFVSNGKKLSKPLQPGPSSCSKSSAEADNRSTVKSPQKSSPSKSVSSLSGSTYVPSSSPVTKQPPSSPTGTLKLKHLNLPSSTTITPVVAKPALPSPTSTAAPSITIVPTTSVAGGSNNLNKPPKSRKGCLNAVIAKLTNTMASPLVGPAAPELPGSRPDVTLKTCEKRDSPTLGKEAKEGRAPVAEGSAIKEGSGIKLTVTKTSGIYKCSSGKAKMGASSSKGSLSSGVKVKSSQKLSGLPVGAPAKKLPTKSPAKLGSSQGFSPCDSVTPGALPTLVPRVAHNNPGSLKNSPKLTTMSKAGARPEKKLNESTKPIVEKETTNLMPPPLHSRTGPKSGEGGQPSPDEAALRMLLGPGEGPDDDQWRALKGDVVGEEHLMTKIENGPEVGPVALTVPRVPSEIRTSEDKGPSTAAALPIPLTKAAPAAAATAGEDDSSPEDGLVIDFAMDSKKAPPVCHSSPRPPEPVVAPELPARASPALSLSAKSPYFVPSPSLKSPQAGSPPSNHSVSSSLSRPSPCVIDDDLMDEAIVGLGK